MIRFHAPSLASAPPQIPLRVCWAISPPVREDSVMLLVARAVVFALPIPIDLVTISPDHARRLNSRRVLATFLIAKPSDYSFGITSIGAADGPDGSERGAQLRGQRFDHDTGTRVNMLGTLRVTDWPAAFIDGVLVPGWVGVVVRE